MRKSITSRYFAATAVILISSVIILGTTFLAFAVRYFRNESVNNLCVVVRTAATLIEKFENREYPYPVDDEKAAELITLEQWTQQLAWQAGSLADADIFITDSEGNTLVCSEGENCRHFKYKLPQRFIQEAANKGEAVDFSLLQSVYGDGYYIAAAPLSLNDGQGVVCAAAEAKYLKGYVADLFSAFFVASGIMLLISSILSIVLTGRVTTPIRKISEAAKSFGKGDFTARVPAEGDDEIAQLAATFNDMATSLEAIDQSRRSFMGNIAHELRTPMTTIKGFIDGMLDGVIPPEDYKHYLEIVSAETGRLTRMIKTMLDISKLEAGEYVINAETYDIWDTVTSALFGAEKRLEENHIGILGFAPNRTLVYADPDIVYQVFYNILDNAIKFTNNGGTITLNITEDENEVTVSVKNTGQGISEEALPHVFDRFYKEDKSRGLHAGGSGLGMNISKVLITRSGGRIWAQSVQDEYAEFFFTLPKGEAPKPQAKRRRGAANIVSKEK